jgi:hypothetical protein
VPRGELFNNRQRHSFVVASMILTFNVRHFLGGHHRFILPGSTLVDYWCAPCPDPFFFKERKEKKNM